MRCVEPGTILPRRPVVMPLGEALSLANPDRLIYEHRSKQTALDRRRNDRAVTAFEKKDFDDEDDEE